MHNTSVYLSVLLRLMKLTLADKIDLRSSEGIEALSVLTEQTKSVAQLAASEVNGMRVSDSLPVGYLVKPCGAWTVAVPWPLVESCPSEDLLSEFCNFASEARVGSDSIMCISGTSARAGGVGQIGDIDLSEYVFDDVEAISARYVGLLTMQRSFTLDVQAMIFSHVPAERVNILCPWPDDVNKYEAEHHLFLERVKSIQTKLDFIGNSSSYGYIPITNMIFPCGVAGATENYSMKTPMAYSSFSFQEAVLFETESTWKAWPLIDVHEYVYYVKFLVKDTLSYLDKRPVKALKRASALARMLRIDEFDLEFEEILRSDFANNDAVASRIGEVRRLAAMRGNGSLSYFDSETVLAALDNAASDAGLTVSDLTFDRFRCRQVVERLLSHIRSNVKTVDDRLEIDLFGTSTVGMVR
ncbi:hypothetical protein [Agrobacterium sp. ST15.16.024]|nr:hypothetical protein [Agrobacterium sp. ST15.16.024]MDA5633703.1 hypothetical protein [Agrobacterium sp. ST15.16.024]